MASNLAGGLCLGELNAAVLRLARLDADCTPSGGANSGVITAGLVSMTADPDIEEGTVFEPKNGDGSIMFTYEEDDKIKRYNLSGEFGFLDFEAIELMFGSSLILGRPGGDFAGEVIGVADRPYNAAPRNGVYLEVITRAVAEGAGSCVTSGSGAPVAFGHIFGKVKLTPGSSNFGNEVKRLAFSGKATQNPALYNGPWNDYPGAGYIPNSPHVIVGYTQAEFDAIVAQIGCGYAADLPAGS